MAPLILIASALAADVELATVEPMMADGRSTVVVHVHIQGLQDIDKLKVKPFDGELLATQRNGESVTLTLKPPAVYKADKMRVEIRVRGGMKLDQDVLVPLEPAVSAKLDTVAAAESWKPGDRKPVLLTISSSGYHPLPDDARSISIRASQGSVSAVKRSGDGWTATWTPPSRPKSHQHVLFVLTDLSAPEQVHGKLELPIDGAAADAPAPVLIAPMGAKLPAEQSLTVWVAGPGNELEGATLDTSRDGFSLYTVNAPERAGSWSLVARSGDVKDMLGTTIVPAVPVVELSADPPDLDASTKTVTVTAQVSTAQGTPQTRSRLVWSGQGLSASGSARSAGDGTYTQRYSVRDAANAQANVRVQLSGTGMPVADILAWPAQDTLVADGSSATTLQIIAVDAWGVPVAKQALALTVPLGDGSVKPGVTTDSYGQAKVDYRSGVAEGPTRVRIESRGGVVGEAVVWQRAADQAAFDLGPTGDDVERARDEQWRRAAPALRLSEAPAVAALDPELPGDGSSNSGTSADGASADGAELQPTDEGARDKPVRDPSDFGVPEGESPIVRVRATVMDMDWRYTASSDGELSAPKGTTTGRGFPLGVGGLGLEVELWPTRGNVGLDVLTRLGVWRVGWGGGPSAEVGMVPVYPTSVNGRFKVGLSGAPVDLVAGVGVQVHNVLLFEFEDEYHASVNPVNQNMFGARLGVGLSWDTDVVDGRIEVAETLNPRLALTQGRFGLDLAVLPGPAYLSFGADVDMQHFATTLGSGDFEDEVVVIGRQITAKAGIGVNF